MKKLYIFISSLAVLSLTCAAAKTEMPNSMLEGRRAKAYGKYTEAVALFQTYLDKNPGSAYNPEVQYLIGESYHLMGQKDKARDAYKKVLDNYLKSPYAALSYRELAKYASEEGQYQKAIDYYKLAKQVLATDANIERCTFETARIYHQGMKNYDAALSEYSKLTKNLKNQHISPQALLNMAAIYAEQKKYDKALETYKIIVNEYSWSDESKPAAEEIKKLEALPADNPG